MKKCSKCCEVLPLTYFCKASKNVSGYAPQCKNCEKSYRQSFEGKLSKMYSSQKSNAKRRRHNPPNYTKDQFIAWCVNNNYPALYEQWRAHNFDRWYAPSADRISDAKSYSLDNLQLVTWGANSDKLHSQLRDGERKVHHKAVQQLTKEGVVTATFVSQLEASRITGVPQGNIGVVCGNTGRRKTAGGFKWRFLNE